MFCVDDQHDGFYVSLAFLFFPIIILLSSCALFLRYGRSVLDVASSKAKHAKAEIIAALQAAGAR